MRKENLMAMTAPTTLLHSLMNLLSFYIYPIACFDISPMATSLAAGLFLLGMLVQGVLLCKRKRSVRFPVLCALAAGVPFFLICLSDVLDRLVDRREVYIPLIHQNPLIYSNLGLYAIIFSVAAAYLLLGVLAGRLAYRAWAKLRPSGGTEA